MYTHCTVSLLLSTKEVARSSIHACTMYTRSALGPCAHWYAAVRRHPACTRATVPRSTWYTRRTVWRYKEGVGAFSLKHVALLLRFDATVFQGQPHTRSVCARGRANVIHPVLSSDPGLTMGLNGWKMQPRRWVRGQVWTNPTWQHIFGKKMPVNFFG